MSNQKSEQQQQVRENLSEVEDPEIPITLQDLGVLREVLVDRERVKVTMVPTRMGCPARGEMERRVRTAIAAVDPELRVEVEWRMEGWTVDDVSPQGRSSLSEAGYSPGAAPRITCPYCGGDDVRRDGEFGGALCRKPFTCERCRSTFDALASAALPIHP